MGLGRASEGLAVGVTMALIGLVAFRPIFAVDLFWLLALGREIVETGSIPQADLFSAIRPDAPWVQFQWLWELLAFAVVDKLGLTGLRATQAVMLVGGYAGLYLLARRRGLGIAAAWLMLSAAVVVFVDRFRLRPDAANLVLLVPLLPTLAGGYRHGKAGRLAFAHCFLWASLHGGGVLFPIAAATALFLGDHLGHRLGAQRATAAHRKASRRLLAGCVLGAAISPTTLPGLRFFLSIYGQMSAGSPEWSPSWTVFAERPHPLTALVAVAPYLVGASYAESVRNRLRTDGRSSIDMGQVLVSIISLALAAAVLRLAFLSLVPLWLVLQPRQADPDPTGARGLGTRRQRGAMLLLAASMLACTTHYAVLAPRHTLANAYRMAAAFDLEPNAFPEEAISFMARAGLRGTVMNRRADGGPLIFYGYPELRVLADSRHNFTPDQWRLVRALEDTRGQAAAVTRGYHQYGLELALLRAPLVRVHPLGPEWQLLFRAGRSEVYQHKKGPHAEDNFAATRRYLRQAGANVSGDAIEAELSRAATAVGAQAFLQHPWRQQQRQLIDAITAQGPGPRQQRAQRVHARMLLDAGMLDDARAVLARLPSTPRTSLYRAELAFEQEEPPQAIAKPLQLALASPQLLSKDERQAAAALRQIVSAHTSQFDGKPAAP
ncbi:MAG: hypothetical protein OXU20_25930 [Myxococcales bacterium]|nr:hypothetical protein [Myxococcales bacterium]